MKKIMAMTAVLFAVAVVFGTIAIATTTSLEGAVTGAKEEVKNYLEDIQKNSSEEISFAPKFWRTNPPTVVIVGGWSPSDRKLMDPLLENIPGAIGIVPNRMLSLKTASKELMRQIREDERVAGKIIIVAASWAGLVARRLDADNPGVVTAIVTIGTGCYFGSMPESIRDFIFGTGDENSPTPLYVIAGYNNSPSRFYMKNGELNDGLVSLKSVLDLGKRKVLDRRVLKGLGHFELFKSKEVIQTTKDWVQIYLNPQMYLKPFESRSIR